MKGSSFFKPGVITLIFCMSVFGSPDIYSQFIEDDLLKYDAKFNSQEWIRENNIKYIQLTTQKINNNKVSKKIKQGNYYVFDEEGMLTKRTYKDGAEVASFTYNDQKQLVEEKVIKYSDNSLVRMHTCTYDPEGRLTEEIWEDQTATYVYEEDRLVEVLVLKGKNKYKRQRFIYDETGQLTEMQYCYRTPPLGDFLPPHCSFRVKFIYNDDGDLITEEVFGPKESFLAEGDVWYYSIVYEFKDKLLDKKTLIKGDYIAMKQMEMGIQRLFRFDFTRQLSMKGMFYSPADYSFPFNACEYEGYKDDFRYHVGGTSLIYSYEGEKIKSIIKSQDKVGRLSAFQFDYNEQGVLTGIILSKASGEPSRLYKNELISITITKYE